MIGFHPIPHFPETLLLSHCTGSLYDEGDTVECGSDCVAHFDANAEACDDFAADGDYSNPYPNSVLSVAAHLPGTDDLTGVLVPPELRGADIRVYRNSGFFIESATDAPTTVFVVVRAPHNPDLHFAAAYKSGQDVWDFLNNAFGETD